MQHKQMQASAPTTVHGATRVVLASTTCGSLVLFFSLVAIFVSWAISNTWTSSALEEISEEFRRMQENYLGEAFAEILRPAWRVTRTFVYHQQAGVTVDGVQVVPPTIGMLDNLTQLERFYKFMGPNVEKDLFMTEAKGDSANRTHWNGVSVAIGFCLSVDNTFAYDGVGCAKVSFSSILLTFSEELDSWVHAVAVQTSDDGSNPLADPNGVGLMFHLWNMQTLSFIPFPPIPGPTVTASRIGFDAFPYVSAWVNFSWKLLSSPDNRSGALLLGLVPLYDRDRQVGGFTFTLSLSQTLQPLLSRAVKSGGSVMRNAFLAVYSVEGFVIGLSEEAAGGGSVFLHSTVESIPTESFTKKAIHFLQAEFGEICPDSGHFNLDQQQDRLVDVTPFLAEEWGIPALPNRWCQVLTVPRDNLYGSADKAQFTSLVVGFLSGAGFFVALSLLLLSLCRVWNSQRHLRAEKRNAEYQEVLQAIAGMSSLGSPMVLMSAGDFLAMEELACYEDFRDCGKLVVLDSLEQVRAFRELHMIVFFSHQWLGFSHPDDEHRTQLKAMQRAIAWAEKLWNVPLYVWLDYTSVAQRHAKAQGMAVASLPVYVSNVDVFIIVAPDAAHRDTNQFCGLSTYATRGWCRLEMLAKACGSGLRNMYIMSGDGASLCPMKSEDFEELSMSVYEGNFTVQRDCEQLVLPILGLYMLILMQASAPHIQSIKAYIDDNKDRFFPESYESGLHVKTRLFGNLVAVMEKHVKEHFLAEDHTVVNRIFEGGLREPSKPLAPDVDARSVSERTGFYVGDFVGVRDLDVMTFDNDGDGIVDM